MPITRSAKFILTSSLKSAVLHNKVLEENKMSRMEKLKFKYPSLYSDYIPHPKPFNTVIQQHSDDRCNELKPDVKNAISHDKNGGGKSISFMDKQQCKKENNTDSHSWGHDGFYELYPEEIFPLPSSQKKKNIEDSALYTAKRKGKREEKINSQNLVHNEHEKLHPEKDISENAIPNMTYKESLLNFNDQKSQEEHFDAENDGCREFDGMTKINTDAQHKNAHEELLSTRDNQSYKEELNMYLQKWGYDRFNEQSSNSKHVVDWCFDEYKDSNIGLNIGETGMQLNKTREEVLLNMPLQRYGKDENIDSQKWCHPWFKKLSPKENNINTEAQHNESIKKSLMEKIMHKEEEHIGSQQSDLRVSKKKIVYDEVQQNINREEEISKIANRHCKEKGNVDSQKSNHDGFHELRREHKAIHIRVQKNFKCERSVSIMETQKCNLMENIHCQKPIFDEFPEEKIILKAGVQEKITREKYFLNNEPNGKEEKNIDLQKLCQFYRPEENNINSSEPNTKGQEESFPNNYQKSKKGENIESQKLDQHVFNELNPKFKGIITIAKQSKTRGQILLNKYIQKCKKEKNVDPQKLSPNGFEEICPKEKKIEYWHTAE